MDKCPHTARRRRGALLNVLTGGRKGRRAKATSPFLRPSGEALEPGEHPEWIVELSRVSHDTATVVVRARDEEEAAELAEELAYSGDIAWEMRGSEDQIDVSDVQLN